MAQGMFGGPIGTSAATTDYLHEAQAENALAQAAMRPYMAREHAAKAESAELAVTAERQYQANAEARRRARQGLPQAPEGGAETPGGDLFRAATEVRSRMDSLIEQAEAEAQDRFDAGQFEKGAKTMNEAALARSRTAATINSMTNAALHRVQAQREAAGVVARYINPEFVQDNLSYQEALHRLPPELAASLPQVYPGQEGVRAIQRAGLSEHDNYTRQHQELTRRETERMNTVREGEIVARRPLVQAQVREHEARAEKLEREGAAPPPVRPAQLKEATDLIGSRYDGVAPEEAGVLGREIIDAARAKVLANPAIRYPQALNLALKEAEDSGVFQPFQKRQPGAPKPGSVTPPSREQIGNALNLLLEEVPELKDDKDKVAAGRAIAARAKVLQKTREPDWDSALRLALEEELEEGSLPIGRRMLVLTRRTYRSGRTVDKARILPADLTKVKPNTFYTDSSGKTMRFNSGNPMDKGNWEAAR